jgi:hypothetical protein
VPVELSVVDVLVSVGMVVGVGVLADVQEIGNVVGHDESFGS